mgnify:CR=1
MQSINEIIQESEAKNDTTKLVELETEINWVLKFNKENSNNVVLYKQALKNRLHVQNAILRILWK